MAKAPVRPDPASPADGDAFLEIDAAKYEEARRDPVVQELADEADRLAAALERDVNRSS